MNRTHTVFFSEDSEGIQKLKEGYNLLVKDWHERSPFMLEEAKIALESRIVMLRHSIELLTERVPE